MCVGAASGAAESKEREVIALWPEERLEAAEKQEEVKTSEWRGKWTIARLANVSRPTLTVFQPKKAAATGPAVVVCPGGGYSILAWDLEGTEVGQWLNGLGVTAFVLKYRVPGQRDGAFEDAQRAVSVVRSRAKEWGIHPRRIGILGFSAGGHLAARASTNHKTRAYKPIDHADTFACRPDFAVLIYPAYMAGKDGLDAGALPVAKDTPPTFIAIAFADRFTTGALHYALALKKARVRAEMLVFHDGSHGCGLRPVDKGLTTWPTHAAQWMRAIKMLDAAR